LVTSTRQKTRKNPKTLKDGSEPEKDIQKRILDWLKDTGVLHWRQNSGTVFLGNRCIKLGEDGLPDIVVIVPPNGRVLGLEVKSAKGQLRPKQTEFMASLRNAGGKYVVVRSLDAAQHALAETMGEEQWKLLPNCDSAPKCFNVH
jgi:hypothetical protein